MYLKRSAGENVLAWGWVNDGVLSEGARPVFLNTLYLFRPKFKTGQTPIVARKLNKRWRLYYVVTPEGGLYA